MSAPQDPPAAIEVTIFGRTYHLRGAEDGEYLQELAGIVDGKMREVADATGTADTLKVAILASLNLADDYLKASDGRSGNEDDPGIAKTLTELTSRLEQAVAN